MPLLETEVADSQLPGSISRRAAYHPGGGQGSGGGIADGVAEGQGIAVRDGGLVALRRDPHLGGGREDGDGGGVLQAFQARLPG